MKRDRGRTPDPNTDGRERLKVSEGQADRMSDPSLPRLPSPHTRLGVGGVLIREGKVVVNRAVYRTRFTLPSGFVERGETLEASLVREFAEETGVVVRVGRLLLSRHKVLSPDESDVYYAFSVEHVSGEPTARPPEIAEVRQVPVDEAVSAPWIAELSRIAIALARTRDRGWPRSSWTGGEAPGLATEAYFAESP